MENKRTITDDGAIVPEIKLEITNKFFVVVCIFKGGLYIHVRKYENRYPTQEGDFMNTEDWRFESLCRDGEKNTNAPYESVLMKKNKNKAERLSVRIFCKIK